MIRRPPRSTQSRSSAASDVYKRQLPCPCMNLDALPYTSFIVLLEFSVGSLLVCLFADWRGRVAASFVKFSAAMVTVAAMLMLLNSFALDPKSAIGGYRLDDGLLTAVKATTIVFLVTTLPYNSVSYTHLRAHETRHEL